jgi:hypothetical protein
MPALHLNTHELVFETLGYENNSYILDSTSEDVSLVTSEPSPNPEDLAKGIDCWGGSWNLFDEFTLANTMHVRPTRLDINLLIKFPFLDNFTKSTGFITSFKCGTKQQRLLITAEAANVDPLLHLQSREHPDRNQTTHWTEIARRALTSNTDGGTFTASAAALMPMTHKIVSLIRDVTVTKHRQSPIDMIWSNSLEALCYDFFHPKALKRHLALFWSCWYPNWPTLHRPAFDVTARAPALVAAMALMGACLSPNDRDYASSQVWLNAVEEIVFSDRWFMNHDISNVWQKPGNVMLRQSQLDILQAADCVCLYQTWEGCKRSKRRILRQRFNDLVYASADSTQIYRWLTILKLARDVGLEHATLRSVDTSHLSAFDWDEYVLRESLIRYVKTLPPSENEADSNVSVCSYICNLDASYALFFRNPPRMTVSELVMELASPEPCFQARSREECFIELRTWRCRSGLGSQRLTILTAIEALSDPAKLAAGSARQVYSQLSVLNMFTLVHALYLLVHHLQTTGIQASYAKDTNPVAIALKQWKHLWSSDSRDTELIDLTFKESQASTAWQSIGFIKHAPEYWLLAHLSLQKLTKRSAGASTTSIGMVGSCEDINMREAQSLISEAKGMTDNLSMARMRD